MKLVAVVLKVVREMFSLTDVSEENRRQRRNKSQIMIIKHGDGDTRGQGQFLVLPAIADCQCLTISCCVYDVASENEFPSDVEAIVSVTMASNTGL